MKVSASMGSMKSKVSVIWLLAVFGLLLTCARADRRIKVGDNVGWVPNVMNYTDWAAKQHFYIGDWLLFVFDKHYFNVLEVNQSNYEMCNDSAFITNITRGGRDVFLLTEARNYYFISSGGYCWNNMKMAINVEQIPPPPPPPQPQKNSSPAAAIIMLPKTIAVISVALTVAWLLVSSHVSLIISNVLLLHLVI